MNQKPKLPAPPSPEGVRGDTGFECPVCFYRHMQYPPKDYNICECCGVEFGNDDTTHMIFIRRHAWVMYNGRFWDAGHASQGWTPDAQIKKLRALLEAKPSPLPNIPQEERTKGRMDALRLAVNYQRANEEPQTYEGSIWSTAVTGLITELKMLAESAAPNTLGTQEERIEALLQVVREYRYNTVHRRKLPNDTYRPPCDLCKQTDEAMAAFIAAPKVVDSKEEQEGASHKMNDDQIKYMVDRFLGWKLPDNFNPDGGISFKKAFNEHTAHPMKHEPTGTNLLDRGQAEKMIRYMVDGIVEAPKVEEQDGEQELVLLHSDEQYKSELETYDRGASMNSHVAADGLRDLLQIRSALREPSKGLDSLLTRESVLREALKAFENERLDQHEAYLSADLGDSDNAYSQAIRDAENAIKSLLTSHSLSPKEPTLEQKFKVLDILTAIERYAVPKSFSSRTGWEVAAFVRKQADALIAELEGSPSEGTGEI